ncbi:MAG: malto-oligosyltrehalose synthase [Acidimicrobiales bacterium]
MPGASRAPGGSGQTVPRSTYRLQMTPSFGFAQAAALAPYLRALGVSHAYLSPVLQAAPGSTHGYDVVDHSKASDDLGGEEAFRSMAAAFRSEGLGIVLDVVPNHMAAALPYNRWWWDVLENGPASFWAAFFDIDWDPPDSTLRNRILQPVLGKRYGRALADGEVTLAFDGRAFCVRYFDNSFPVAPRSLDRLLADAARATGSPELEFIAGALGDLPLASETDRERVRRRHRDKGVLLDRIAILCAEDTGIARAIERSIADVNGDLSLLDALLERQNYRLAYWRTADQQLDYRRFFDIDTLVALRIEDPEAFIETHQHILDWVHDGLVDGLRIDHIDGLGAPQRYLERLSERSGARWTVVEKILESGERLPESWPVAGTTGYDFLNLAAKLFVDPAGEEPLTSALASLTGDTQSPAETIRIGKELILDTSLAADLHRIVERVLRLTEQTPALRDITRLEVHTALRALVAAFGVYRTYGAGSPSTPGDLAIIEEAASRAAMTVDLDEDLVAFLVDVLAGRGAVDPARLDIARRFEQLTGPVMAKGVEDTAFYRYHRFIAVNEVGNDLEEWATSPEHWHRHWVAGAERLGGSLLATATHDTKRSEDVRARLFLLSEIPEHWRAVVERWRVLTDRYRRGELPDRTTEYLLFQTLVGAWPLTADRAVEYARKATREAKVHTSWTDPDEDYDDALEDWIRRILGDAEFIGALESFVGGLVTAGRTNSLAQTLLKLTSPGIPDIYQGTELWDLSLVDPDNRRPVDYAERARLLAELDTGSVGPADALARADDGWPKLMVVKEALALRQRRPTCFGPAAGYRRVVTSGPRATNVVAFGRGPAGSGSEVVTVIPRLVMGLATAGGWGDTIAAIPPGSWRDVLCGVEHQITATGVPVRVLLDAFPVALLEREG